MNWDYVPLNSCPVRLHRSSCHCLWCTSPWRGPRRSSATTCRRNPHSSPEFRSGRPWTDEFKDTSALWESHSILNESSSLIPATNLWGVLKVVEIRHVTAFTFQDLRWTPAAHHLLQSRVHLFIAQQYSRYHSSWLSTLCEICLADLQFRTTHLNLICADWNGLCCYSSPKQSDGLHVASTLCELNNSDVGVRAVNVRV